LPVARRTTLALADIRTGVELIGTINGSNTVFSTPDSFVRISPGLSIAVYYNGQRLREGLSDDYSLSESGGPGMGWDTVTLSFAPKPGDTLSADYAID
jgi:hypothetical protein